MINSSLDLVRATEAAAVAASQWIGRGDKLSADKAATDAMKEHLDHIEFSGKIVIGEGIKDNSYGLFKGDKVGKYREEDERDFLDIAVDPIDGTRPTVTLAPEALSVLAIAGQDCLFDTEEFYMNKLAYGGHIASKIQLSLEDPLKRTLEVVSAVTGKSFNNIVVCVLDRPRHEAIIKELREIGVKVKLIQDCDISGAIATCLPESGIDLMYGIGGSPEGVITACAMKCMGGGLQVQLVNPEGEIVDPKIYTIDDMVKGPCAFAATGITDGSLLRGVRFTKQGPFTNSVTMRSEHGTIRWIKSFYRDS